VGADQAKAILDYASVPILTPMQFGFNAFVFIVEKTGRRKFDAKDGFVPIEAFQTNVSFVLSVFFSYPNNSVARLITSMVQEEYRSHSQRGQAPKSCPTGGDLYSKGILRERASEDIFAQNSDRFAPRYARLPANTHRPTRFGACGHTLSSKVAAVTTRPMPNWKQPLHPCVTPGSAVS
jgi:hypothetical protein